MIGGRAKPGSRAKRAGAEESHPPAGGPSAPAEAGERGVSVLELAVIAVLFLCLLFGVIRPFVAETFYIPSSSMEPTLAPGDSVLDLKFAYLLSEPERGDLAAIQDPENANQMLIKRVAGLPTDTIEIRDGVLYVNGEKKEEPYVDYNLTDSSFFGPVEVPPGHVFVLGDNRSNSRDSRDFGPVAEQDLRGQVVLRFWPLSRLRMG